MAAPVFIEPTFNKYTPVTDPKVRDPISGSGARHESSAEKFCGGSIDEKTKSQRQRVGTSWKDADRSQRQFLNQCTCTEIREVMAHEMGHYVSIMALRLRWRSRFYLRRVGMQLATFQSAYIKKVARGGVKRNCGSGRIPVLMLIFATTLPATPIENTMRPNDRRERIYRLNARARTDAASHGRAQIGSIVKWSRPAEDIHLFDHPSGRSRIRMAMDWGSSTVAVRRATVGWLHPPHRTAKKRSPPS